MQRNIIKIILDVVMAFVLVLLYNTHVLRMGFHEIGGLFLFFIFIVHCLLNKKWIVSVTTKYFNSSLSLRTKFCYVVNLLLLISFLTIIISGICFSTVLFPTLASNEGPWRTLHLFFSGISLILIGIHLGLHWTFVSAMCKKMVGPPPKIFRPISVGLLVVVLGFGVYSTITSNFMKWLASPFVTEQKSEDHTDIKENASDSSALTPKNTETINDSDLTPKVDEESKQGISNNSGNLEEKSTEGSPMAVVSTIATFLSIIGVFAAATYYLDKLFLRRRKSLSYN